MVTVNAENKIEINYDVLKNKPKLISLMKMAKQYRINIDNLNHGQISNFIKISLFSNR